MYGCGYPSYGYSYGANGFWIIIVVLIIFFILFWNNAMRLREDVAKDHKFKREEMLANAPEVQAGCLVVPKTVE